MEEVDCRFGAGPFRFSFLFLCYGLLLHQHPVVVGSRVSFINHGYRDIVIAISPNVPQDQGYTLLRQIQVHNYSSIINSLILTNSCLIAGFN